jgi:hypothetical protein
MSTRSRTALAATLLLGSTLASAEPAATPRLGRAATAAELQALDLSIAPDGLDLPPGRASVAQGQAIYAAHCQSCHYARGAGQSADRLTGGIGTLATPAPVKTVASFWPHVTTLFDTSAAPCPCRTRSGSRMMRSTPWSPCWRRQPDATQASHAGMKRGQTTAAFRPSQSATAGNGGSAFRKPGVLGR